MSIVIASGGGEIGRPGYSIETTGIDLEAIKYTNRKNPKLLFVPTASGDSQQYCETVVQYFGKKLSCNVENLLLLKKAYTIEELDNHVRASDIIYVGGGNSLKLMMTWRKTGFDKVVNKYFQSNKVFYGLSAGSICWFSFGGSFSRRVSNLEAKLIKVKGLGLYNFINCPHYGMEMPEQKGRKEQFKEILKNYKGIGIANDECSAIEFNGTKYRIIKSKNLSNVYRVYWKSNNYYEEKLNDDGNYREIRELHEI